MKVVALILARGGSKGLPNKNIIDLCGKPLLAYSVIAAQQSQVDEIWVSTDSNKIAEVALDLKASVLMRPAELATDSAPSELAILHFLENVNSDLLVFMQPTSPLVLSRDINVGLEKIKKVDSVFSAYREHWLPRWNLNLSPDQWSIGQRPRRQDVSEKYVENGAFYIARPEFIIKHRCRYGGNLDVVEMPFIRSFQIDTVDDLELVKSIMVEGSYINK